MNIGKLTKYKAMPITSSVQKKVSDDGEEKNILHLEFSNGAFEQLEDLRKYFKWKEITDPIRFGISLLQQAKEHQEEEDKKKCAENEKIE